MDSHVNDFGKLIEVDNVSFHYGSMTVLCEISFSIKSGDFLAILGPNGSGKTTLLKVILGLKKPAQGRVRIMGQPVEDFLDWRIIGYVPQNATHIDPFFPASVREVVAMGFKATRQVYARSKREEEVFIEEALDHVNMKRFKDWRIGRLSGGQQQRVFIARAIVNQPKILFLDEPTTGVDAQTQDQFYDMLDSLNERGGITIVLVTHETGIINKHVKQVACLNQKLMYHGTHSEFCQSQIFKQWLEEGHHIISHKH
jgi:zinc transport system ATP-binding protein